MFRTNLQFILLLMNLILFLYIFFCQWWCHPQSNRKCAEHTINQGPISLRLCSCSSLTAGDPTASPTATATADSEVEQLPEISQF